MELQINQFWKLKVHSMINSTSECEPGLLNTFCATRVKKTQNFTKNVWAHQCFCHFADFAVFERQFLPEYYTQREKTLNFTSSLAAWSQFISNKFPSLGKALCKWAKMSTMTSAKIPPIRAKIFVILHGNCSTNCYCNYNPCGIFDIRVAQIEKV